MRKAGRSLYNLHQFWGGNTYSRIPLPRSQLLHTTLQVTFTLVFFLLIILFPCKLIFLYWCNSLSCTSQWCEGDVHYERFEVRLMGRICTSLTVVMICRRNCTDQKKKEIVQTRKTFLTSKLFNLVQFCQQCSWCCCLFTCEDIVFFYQILKLYILLDLFIISVYGIFTIYFAYCFIL